MVQLAIRCHPCVPVEPDQLEADEREPLLAGHRLADALRDMRLLGLQPTLLARTPGNNSRGSDAKPA